MTPQDFDYVIDLARREAGLEIRADKAFFAETRLAPLARREGFASTDAMIAELRKGLAPALCRAMVEALASGETSFFRDRAVFDRLQGEIIPTLAARRPGRPLRIWSAGCATGQEVYSLALAADAAGPRAPAVELFASDLSERALQKAKAGLFSHFEVQRGLPIRMLLAHFEKADDLWRVSARMRQSIRWAQVNLTGDLSGTGPFDIILCRNVMNAFTREAADATLLKLEDALASDGCLVLGVDEAPTLPAAFSGRGGVYLRDPAFRREAA